MCSSDLGTGGHMYVGLIRNGGVAVQQSVYGYQAGTTIAIALLCSAGEFFQVAIYNDGPAAYSMNASVSVSMCR